MKSENRTWFTAVLLFIFYSMIFASPFVYFADMITGGIGRLASFIGLKPAASTLMIYLLVSVLTALFLQFGKKQYRLYLAGFFILSVLVHHLIICLKNGRLYDVSLPIVIVLALALVFLLIRNRTPGLFLADAFITALPVWLIYDSVLVLLFSWFDWSSDRWQPIFVLSDKPLIFTLDNLFRLPWQLWTLVPLAFAVIPMIFLSRNRSK